MLDNTFLENMKVFYKTLTSLCFRPWLHEKSDVVTVLKYCIIMLMKINTIYIYIYIKYIVINRI